MKNILTLLVVLSLTQGAFAQSPAKAQPARKSAHSTANPRLLPVFPDFGHMVDPAHYNGRTFKLSQDFPKTKPAMDAAVKKILQIDFTQDWKKYILAVRDYIYEGNIERDVPDAFYLEDNKVRHWYHVPWQHYGHFGREGIHGLTKEGPEGPGTLSPSQTHLWQTYAVGFYNDLGGWTIGRVWADPNNPSMDAIKNGGFPAGTVVGKVLFTTAPPSEVPFLSSPIEWLAYTTKTFSPFSDDPKLNPRQMSVVRFIQMDIMVRDPRADKWGGWVFGTFVYNGALAEYHTNPWYNVVPVGLQWGNDPTVTSHSESNPSPTKTEINPDLKESVINTDPDMPPMHLGFGLRLIGPVDNTMSSCMSCHSTAQFPQISALGPSFVKNASGKPQFEPASPGWMRWFRNIPCATPFDPEATSSDYSLQLAASVQNFIAAKGAETGGIYHVQYWQGKPVWMIYGQRGKTDSDSEK
jgi:hypothetical protein